MSGIGAMDPALLRPMGSLGLTWAGGASALGFAGVGLAFLGVPGMAGVWPLASAITSNLWGFTIGNAELVASMSRSSTRTLMRSQLRSVSGQPATLHVGDRYPIQTNAYIGPGTATPPTGGGAAATRTWAPSDGACTPSPSSASARGTSPPRRRTSARLSSRSARPGKRAAGPAPASHSPAGRQGRCDGAPRGPLGVAFAGNQNGRPARGRTPVRGLKREATRSA